MLDNTTVAAAAKDLCQTYMDGYEALEVISLSTTDGFPVHNHSRGSVKFDVDTMAAAASTLYSVSNAVSKQILAKHFNITIIESQSGNIGFVALSLGDKDFVLAISASDEMNIGKLRVLINRLADEIKKTTLT
ncbi:MAG: roadblock/LC7 domain-containing protein [Pseudomonadota bacterium]|nr:hypothetical protein [Pseudomonadales bacterium]MDY6918990.1 roadblock/LC7 domain-containing protein [Pseudomonadota bacterium]